MFGISGPVPVETVWQHKLADKNAFKEFAHGKIQNYYSEKLKSKIQRSSSLRFIHEDDFDFRDKKLHPLITTAYLIQEKPNSHFVSHTICFKVKYLSSVTFKELLSKTLDKLNNIEIRSTNNNYDYFAIFLVHYFFPS